MAAFIGASAAIFNISLIILFLLISLIILPIFFIENHLIYKSLLAVTLSLTTFFYTTHHYLIPSNGLYEGQAIVSFSSITFSKNHFGNIWVYKGTLSSFMDEENFNYIVAQNLPFTLSLPSKSNFKPYSTDHQYRFKARLKVMEEGQFNLIINQNTIMEPISTTWDIPKWRFESKTFIRRIIYSSIKDLHAAAFLAGITTGEFDDKQLEFELGRFGLQHLMAISGLHFAILGSILGFLLRLIFPYRIAVYLLIGLLSLYFLFLGSSPSVVRAWIALSIGLVGVVIGRRSLALNSLGVALLAMAFLDPFAARHIGFQFSFAVTAAILLWFPFCETLCGKIFNKRKLSDIVEMTIFSQHSYYLLHFLRQALALTIAVNLIALPMTLFHFNKFPFLSLIYNLFFPLLTSLSMILLSCGLLISLVFPWLANHIYSLTEHFTQFMLSFAFNLPKSFDIALRIENINKEALIIYLMFIFVSGLIIKFRKNRDTEISSFV